MGERRMGTKLLDPQCPTRFGNMVNDPSTHILREHRPFDHSGIFAAHSQSEQH